MSGEGMMKSGSSRRSFTSAFCAEYKYNLKKTLGIGAFSKVKLAVHQPTGQKVAIKIMNRNKMKDMEDKGAVILHKFHILLPIYRNVDLVQCY